MTKKYFLILSFIIGINLSYGQNKENFYKWIDDNLIFEILENELTDIQISYDSLICISKNYEYCLLLRFHKSWMDDNGDWFDENIPPELNESGRWVLNFYMFDKKTKIKGWSKIYVPLKYTKIKLESCKSKYKIYTNEGIIEGNFKSIENLMWKLSSVNPQSEKDIEKKFDKL